MNKKKVEPSVIVPFFTIALLDRWRITRAIILILLIFSLKIIFLEKIKEE